MRPQTFHFGHLNRKTFDFEDSCPRSHENIWIMWNLQRWSHKPYGQTCWAGVGLKSACAFDTSLATFLFTLFSKTCGKCDQTRLHPVCASPQLVWYILIINFWRRLKDAFAKRNMLEQPEHPISLPLLMDVEELR